MKYDILSGYREHLDRVVNNGNTANRYYYAVDSLLNNMQFNNLSEIPCDTLMERLQALGTRNEFSAAKIALKHLKAFDGGLNLPTEQFFKETAAAKRNRSKRPAKTINVDTTHRKVNAIRDVKLKLAYRLMEKSGLRVSEAAALVKRDISIDGDGVIKIDVKHGKGGSNDVVTCMPDAWLAENLSGYLSALDDGEERLFYAESTLRDKARKLGLECHDFRRIAANTFRDTRRDEGEELNTANEQTRDFLRHARFSVTKRYLRNRKLKIKRK